MIPALSDDHDPHRKDANIAQLDATLRALDKRLMTPADELPSYQSVRSSNFSAREVLLVLGLLGNLAGFVWSAATMVSRLDQTSADLKDLKLAVQQTGLMAYRIDKLEAKVERMENALPGGGGRVR